MQIGVVKEIKPDENRVALTPAGAVELRRRGHDVLVEQSAGEGSALPDSLYEAVGAQIGSVDEVWSTSDLVLKVNPTAQAHMDQFIIREVKASGSIGKIELHNVVAPFELLNLTLSQLGIETISVPSVALA